MAKILFFFTSSYPFGAGETFIENEIEYLANTFDKVVIVSNDISNEQTRKVPINVTLERKSYELSNSAKLLSTFQINKVEFWKEIAIIKTKYKRKITLPILNTMLQTLHKGKVWRKYIKKIISKYAKKDKVYLYSYWNNDMAYVIANYKKTNSEIKAFSRMHGWDVYFAANEINYLPFRNYIFNYLDMVFAISNKGKEYYSKLLGLEKKIIVSNLGVPFKGKNTKEKSNKLEILTISNTVAIKNLEVLVKALNLLEIDFRWTHIGDGYLQGSIQETASKLIPDKFILTGRISNYEVISYLQNNYVDVFINVSLSEGIPVSIMEVMSFGIPCIATAVGGTPEIVNIDNGMLMSENPNSSEVVDAITSYFRLSDSEKRSKREAAFNTWNVKYNAEKNYYNFVEQILRL